MHPKGTIYDSQRGRNHGESVLLLPFFMRLAYQFARGLGAGLIALAFLIFSFSYGPIIEQEISYNLKGEEEIEEKDYSVAIAEADEILAVQNEARSYGVGSYFSVAIPEIEAYSNVLANVNVSDKDEYQSALQKGIAHARGTYFPGQNGTTFLFSHSTDSPLNFARYNAVFYLLKKLEMGDQIIVFFADKKYVYEVSEKVVADAGDTSWLVPKKESEELILMTCDPPGTTWRRLLVIAKPVGER